MALPRLVRYANYRLRRGEQIRFQDMRKWTNETTIRKDMSVRSEA